MQKIINLDFYITHTKELKINQKNDTNITTNQKQTHRLREEIMIARGKDDGKGELGSLEWTRIHCYI